MPRNGADNPNKLRGGYYTPPPIARWLCDWAIRSKTDRVLEPSCGDGAFLEAAMRRLAELGADATDIGEQLWGVEIDKTESGKSQRRAARVLAAPCLLRVWNGDFFEWILAREDRSFDCVVGNPPFIRYQTFPEPSRSLAMDLLIRHGLRPNKLTNIWVPFVVGAVRMLRPGGRLAMVLPAELLQVSYAGQLRSFLADRFTTIDIVACNELFFHRRPAGGCACPGRREGPFAVREQ